MPVEENKPSRSILPCVLGGINMAGAVIGGGIHAFIAAKYGLEKASENPTYNLRT